MESRRPKLNGRPLRAGSIRLLRARLLAWYGRHKRALPWRNRPEPYRVWISEIMLQQTRVQTVLPYYERFLRRFPDIEALAAADESEVRELWAGLGYYRRAQNLWQAARKISSQSAGKFPGTLEEISNLPGIGRYTAGAIFSIAFNQPQAVVDGNVRRVISRVHGIGHAPESFFWTEAEAWLAHRKPADFNQALMELGALVCTPIRPSCGKCPLRRLCRSANRNIASAESRSPTESIGLVILVIRHKRDLLVARQTEPSFIPGPWILPFREIPKGADPVATAAAVAQIIFSGEVRLLEAGTIRHAITTRRIVAHVVSVTAQAPVPRDDVHVWLEASQAAKKLTSSLFRKALLRAIDH